MSAARPCLAHRHPGAQARIFKGQRLKINHLLGGIPGMKDHGSGLRRLTALRNEPPRCYGARHAYSIIQLD
jgi:hypothetical protein